MANSNTGWDLDDDDDEQGNQPPQKDDKDGKGLRTHLKKMEMQNKELAAKLAEFEAKETVGKITKAVTDKGYDPMVAELVPTDVAKDDAALEKWLTEREKLFGKVQKEEEQMIPTGFDDNLPDEDAAAYGRISKVANSSLPASKDADSRAAINGSKTREELNEYMRRLGNTFVG